MATRLVAAGRGRFEAQRFTASGWVRIGTVYREEGFRWSAYATVIAGQRARSIGTYRTKGTAFAALVAGA